MSNPGPLPKKILVVDDEPFVCDTVKLLLAFDGHSVETALSGRDALEKFTSDKFDLVITDYSMPEMKGDELGAKIKALVPNQPVVLITAYTEMLRGAETPLAGVDIVVSKPFLLEDLRKAIAQATEQGSGQPA
jgi:two-component system, cell cycle sensor histidine kinase and response regulator CckA